MAFQEVERERSSRRRAAPDRDALPPDLAEALDDLREARAEAREEGFPEPSGGGARCLAAIGDDRRREAYADAGALPDGFLRAALDDLGRAGAPEA